MFMRVVLSGAMLLVAMSAVAGEPSMEFVGASSTDLDNPHDLNCHPMADSYLFPTRVTIASSSSIPKRCSGLVSSVPITNRVPMM